MPPSDLLDAALRTFAAVGDAHEAWRVTYLRRFKAKKALTSEQQVAEQLIYSPIFDPAEHERSANVVDGLLAALDKRLEIKDKTAREKRERERREAEAKNKNDMGRQMKLKLITTC
eukprot:jgi/Tetstr1/440411/TSEL_028745.t1